MKKLLASAVILTAGFMTNGSAFAQPVPIKLFNGQICETVTPNVPPSEAILFGLRSVMLDIQPGDTYVISSTADGNGPIVIDNFMTINSIANICENVSGQQFPDSCFGPPLIEFLPTDRPIEEVLGPVGPIDVTHILSALPRGRSLVGFALHDFGTIAGNTDLFLVIAGPDGGSPAGGLFEGLFRVPPPVVRPIDCG